MNYIFREKPSIGAKNRVFSIGIIGANLYLTSAYLEALK